MKHLLTAFSSAVLYALFTLATLYASPSMQSSGPVGAGVGLFFLYLIASTFFIGFVAGLITSMLIKRESGRTNRIAVVLIVLYIPILVFLFNL